MERAPTGTGRRERADAIRNRRAILAATEELLAAHPPQDVSMEKVAAAAGVGKGTVFHRFGSRVGLMRALMVERAQSLGEAVGSGPPPLGPGAPPRDRLMAFLAAVIDVVSRNKSLLAELTRSGVTEAAVRDAQPPAGNRPPAEDQAQPGSRPGDGQDRHPVYWAWHQHVSALIAAQRPDLDADLIAHLILGAMHSEPVLAQLAAGGRDRVTAATLTLAAAVLDAPR
jgi:AcrR family transcriptional regulator